MKILLLNPPGRRLYLRDYFCSKVSQADYVHPPIDLVVQSGYLAKHVDVSLVDAIVDGLSPERTLDRVRAIAPDSVLMLVGAVSEAEDLEFARSIRPFVAGPVVGIGDLFLEAPREWLEREPVFDAVATDFAGDHIARYFAGERVGLSGIVARDTYVHHPHSPMVDFAPPVPRHELFLSHRYRYGLLRRRPMASVLTDYGCPYRCSFCVMPSLGYRTRPLDNVIKELEALKRLGARDLFFLDQTFGLPRRRALELLRMMERRRYGFGWAAFVRADTSDDDLLAAMRRAGCHTVIFGVESGDEAALVEMKKDLTTAELRAGFERARRAGLRTAATILLGLPGETHERFERTLAIVRELAPDFLSVNVAVPRNGTALRREALDEGLVDQSVAPDQSGTTISIRPRAIVREDVMRMRTRAVRDFYLRPRFIARRALDVRSFGELSMLATNARALLGTK